MCMLHGANGGGDHTDMRSQLLPTLPGPVVLSVQKERMPRVQAIMGGLSQSQHNTEVSLLMSVIKNCLSLIMYFCNTWSNAVLWTPEVKKAVKDQL